MTGAEIRGEYPNGWAELARKVKSEAGWRCVRCGHPDHPEDCTAAGLPRGQLPCDGGCTHRGPTRQRVLTVHHLDGDKGNGAWWNLLALCQVCHLVIQAKVQLERCYLWPHSHWFRPYVAGYYAWAVLGQELSRAEVDDRIEELLALGQPHLGPSTGASTATEAARGP
jgi:5-methylcytosine-specific restriction endonuclease McrA